MIDKTQDLTKEEILKVFLFSKRNYLKFYNYITKEDYDNFRLTEQLIDNFNLNFKANDFLVTNWIKYYPKVTFFFYLNIFYPKVIIWNDRKKTEYYEEKLQMGFNFENYICQFFKNNYSFDIETYKTKEGQYNLGESIQGIEIKNDTRIFKTGNIYIELQEKKESSQRIWVNSGILKNDNTLFYLIGTEKEFYIFLKADLLELYQKGEYFKKVEIATSKGILLKIKEVEKLLYSPQKMINYIQNMKK